MPIQKNVKKYKTEGPSLDLNKDRSGCRKTERTQENINLLQEKLIEDLRISAKKNTFNRITKVKLGKLEQIGNWDIFPKQMPIDLK